MKFRRNTGVRDEEFTFEAYERAIRYFSRSVPAMIDTTIIRLMS